ncbi:MAG: Hint domain-containing protein [Pseudobdellovibrionaceae bacterium]|nr:Hint domain-containing protein [Pseudobdellovibrionaceae bacterium]
MPDIQNPDFCESKIVTVAVNHPELDYICAYPTVAETGVDKDVNSARCINADKKFCQLGAGGEAGPGSHHIPQDGWYHRSGISDTFPDVRCQCGCFIGETMITHALGYERIDSLAERSKVRSIGVLQYSPTRGISVSKPLSGRDFTVGPEDKEVVRIIGRSGDDLTVTSQHPIFVERKGSWIMIEAEDLKAGDILMKENGNIDAVLALESYLLDTARSNVYNLDTKAQDPEDHIISANGFRVGDIYWQKRLSEEASRVENLLEAANQ